MKLTSLITLVFAAICLMMEYVLTYWFGYYEKWGLSIVWIVVLRLLGFFIPLLVLLITWIISLFWKKHRLWTTAMLIGLLVLIGLTFKQIIPPPQNLIIYSMRDRMMRDYSLDDLRRLARDVDQLPRSPDNRPGPTKIFMREDFGKTGLKGKYPFLFWDKEAGFEGPSYISESDGVVNVLWGGTLAGHWGFTVSVNGGKANPTEPGTKILRVSDDIFFSVGE